MSRDKGSCSAGPQGRIHLYNGNDVCFAGRRSGIVRASPPRLRRWWLLTSACRVCRAGSYGVHGPHFDISWCLQGIAWRVIITVYRRNIGDTGEKVRPGFTSAAVTKSDNGKRFYSYSSGCSLSEGTWRQGLGVGHIINSVLSLISPLLWKAESPA